MSPGARELLEELRTKIRNDRRKALLDAYLKQPDAHSIADEALKLLSKAVDENQTT